MPPNAATLSAICAQSSLLPPAPARIGISASAGITAISWNSNTENPSWPPSLRFMPFSRISCSAIAVDDIASPMPPITAACQAK
ncbi:hypothetical protein D3C86_2085010 [compost metagenome]